MSREIENDPREIEYAVGGISRPAALRSLARSRGLPVSVVARHAQNETLRCVVEHRSAERRAEDKLAAVDMLIALHRRRRLAEIREDYS
jgi:hypothetical protein